MTLLQKIIIRKAQISDSRFIYDIRNHPTVRRVSLKKEKINFKEHKTWFLKKYFGKHKNFCFVADIKKRVIGYCRIDLTGGVFFISIALHPDYLGRGYGSRLLKDSLEIINTNKKIMADVRENNVASLKFFLRNNFVIYKKSKGVSRLKYQKISKLRVAIIGAGRIGAFFDKPGDKNILTHAHAYFLHPKFELAAFVDSDIRRARLAAKRWGGRAYDTVEQLFKNEKIDVVSVCVPDNRHYAVMAQLKKFDIAGGIVEKPLTDNLTKSVNLAKDNHFSRKFIINYTRRFTPEILRLREDIVKNKYGRFICGRGYYGKGLLHNGSHLLDLLLYFGFEAKGAKITDKIIDFTSDDPSYSAQLYFKNGGVFSLQAISRKVYAIFEFELFFEKARLRFVDGALAVEIYTVQDDAVFAGYKKLTFKEKRATHILQLGMSGLVENLYQVVSGRGKPVCSLADGVKVQRLCDNIRKENL